MLGNDTVIKRNVEITMRDQVTLRADLYLPRDERCQYPCLIQRTPYNKEEVYKKLFPPEMAAANGYAVLVQDTRGRFASNGEFDLYHNDVLDGYDTVEWAAKQTWCTGKIGMYGGSYGGITQLLAAVSQPPHLITICPAITNSLRYDGYVYEGGVFRLVSYIGWTLMMIQDTAKKNNIELPGSILDVLEGLDELHHISFSRFSDSKVIFEKTNELQKNMQRVLLTLPLENLPIPKKIAAYFFDWLKLWKDGDYWEKYDITQYYKRIKIPMLHIGGWYDLFTKHTLENFQGFSNNVAYQRLVMGPWSHGMYSQKVGELDFGNEAEYRDKLNALHLQWFDYWLKGSAAPIENEPAVQYFVMGENQWRKTTKWPLKETRYIKWYLHSSGKANTLRGNGVLSMEQPSYELPDRFIYNPEKPVPSMGGSILPLGMNPGPRNQKVVEEREDVLVYTSEPLLNDLEITGPLKVILWASTDSVDTDFTAKLVDVHPGGFAQNLQDGIIRTSFRNSYKSPCFIIPNEIYEYEIDLAATSNLFKQGHSIRLEISSSNFPCYSRNLNTGVEHSKGSKMKVANQMVYHNEKHASHVVLPVIPKA